MAADGSTLYAGVGDATVVVWRAVSSDMVCKLTGHMEHHAVTCLLLHDSILYTGAWDGLTMRWDTATIEDKLKSQVKAVPDVTMAIEAEKQPEKVVQSIFDETDCELLD